MASEPVKEYPNEIVRGTFFEHDVPVDKMFVEFREHIGGYARPLSVPRATKLKAEFKRQALGVLLLSYRDNGTFAIIDGQHRWSVAKSLGIKTLDALVYIDLSLEAEAELYRMFGDYLKQTPLDKFHAGIAAHNDMCIQIALILDQQGLYIPQTLGQRKAGIVAVDGLQRVYTTYGKQMLQNTILLLNEAWNGEPRAYRSSLVIGTAKFLARYQDHAHFVRKRLLARMQKQGMNHIERKAADIRHAAETQSGNPSSAWGQALKGLHDFRASEGDELPDWPKKLYSESAKAKLAANILKVTSAQTHEQRSAQTTKANQTLGPEGRSKRTTKAARTRRGYRAKDVRCPYCNALPDVNCFNADGEVAGSSHRARKRLAIDEARKKLTQ